MVDDHAKVLRALGLLFKREGFACRSATDPTAALDLCRNETFDLALIDLNFTRDTTSGEEGLNLLSAIRTQDPEMPVLVMTAWAQISLAVEATRRGAADFIEKPWSNDRLLQIVNTQLELSRTRSRNRGLQATARLLGGADEPLLSEDPGFKKVMSLLDKVAPTDANILITGENGTGKGMVARRVHRRSPRGAAPLISVNMGAIPESLFESEMFGHIKGAFTGALESRPGRFEIAEGGTLFLDEIATIPISQQPKLLRVLETGEFEAVGSSRTHRADVRLISATNADFPELIAAGRFRQDLLFRLNTIEVHLPPLRDRGDDVLVLAEHFLKELAARYNRRFQGFARGAMSQLQAYDWPGNVRELRHVIERAVLVAAGPVIEAGDLALQTVLRRPGLDGMTLAEAEKYLIQTTLDRFGGNAVKAAEALGVSKSAIYRRMEKHGLGKGSA